MVAMAKREEPQTLHEWRCWKCRRIIARLALVRGCTIEVKCRCGAMNVAALPPLDKDSATA